MPTSKNPWSTIYSPTVGKDELPIYLASHEDAIEPRNQRDDSALIGQALLNRYREHTVPATAQDLSNDLGMNGVNIRVQPGQDLRNSEGHKIWGSYLAARDQGPGADSALIKFETKPSISSPFVQLSTLAHELGHAADDVYASEYEGPDEEKNSKYNIASGVHHHANFTRIEPEMAQAMEAQRAIEQGLPVNPELMGAYPYLQNVKPASSNRLANPWAFDVNGWLQE